MFLQNRATKISENGFPRNHNPDLIHHNPEETTQMASIQQRTLFYPFKPINKTVAFPLRRMIHPVIINPAFAAKKLRVLSLSSLGHQSSSRNDNSSSSEQPSEPDPSEVEADPVKLAFAKAKGYKKALDSNPTPEMAQNPVQKSPGNDGSEEELKLEVSNLEALKSGGKDNEKGDVPLALKLAFEKAKEYKKNKGVVDGSEVGQRIEQVSGTKVGNEEGPGKAFLRNDDEKKKGLKISSIDFVGLDFSEKKKGKGLPAGLVPLVDSFPEGDLPEVEILVGDASKFEDGDTASNSIQEEDLDIYKPKVSTWGVFSRPRNISKTYGGGRVIHPGEEFETAGDRAAKEARTKQLLSAYKSKTGMNIHPKLKSECEKVLKEGDSLMDGGKLKEALPFYAKVMESLAFQTELYGLAALQWSICQDSLSRPNEAKVMYEKLQSHPNPQVSKKARQLAFSFQAMEMMKVTSTTISPTNTSYQNYFDAFVKDSANYPTDEAESDEAAFRQALPYAILLFAPILLVFLVAILKRQS